MLATLKKLKCLEAYVATDDDTLADSVLDKSLTKLLLREQMRMQHVIRRLREDLEQFEERHQLVSQDFYERYHRGEMGDAMDFIEWAATVEMLAASEKRRALLDTEQ